MTQPLLEVHDLRVSIDTRSGPLEPVQGVSLSVDPGEIVGVVGESGCGKSTLLRAIAGVMPRGTWVSGGTIGVNGRSLRLGERSADLAMIFQDPMTSLNPVMRVGDQIAEVPRRRDGMSKTAARDLAVELILYVTHDLPLIGTLCRRLNVMYAGQVLERGAAESVLRHSRHPYTRALLGAAPRIGDRPHRLDAIPGQPPRLTAGLVGCPFVNRCTYGTAACAHGHAAAPDTALHETGCVRAEDIEWPTVVRAL